MTTARILVADDWPCVQLGLQSVVATLGPAWEVCGLAATGPEAVAQAIALTPDIVIMDDRLPELDGLAAATEIQRRLPDVEVLLFCEAHSPAAVQQIYHSSVRGCLLKSEAPEDLIAALESVRRHHRFRSRAITDLCAGLAESAAACASLTKREIEILCLIWQDLPSKEIGSELGISMRTVEVHRTHMREKFKARTVIGLIKQALSHGIIEL